MTDRLGLDGVTTRWCRSLATVLDPGLDYINGAPTIPPTR